MNIASCPFCGAEIVVYYDGWKPEDTTGRNPSICCEGCGIGFSAGYFFSGISDKEAKIMTIEAWNRRVLKTE